MANITPPYVDPGRASFEVLDTHLQSYLLAGQDPQLKPAFSFPLANNTSFTQFQVVGLDVNGKLTAATYGRAPVAATGALTFTNVGVAAETITIGTITYTLVAALTAANQILIGASATATAANLAAAINGAAGEGTVYGTGTKQHPSVSASAAAGVVTVTARQIGSIGNQVVTTETSTVASFAAATLTGGFDQGGVRPIGIMAQAASLGASGTANGQVWYSGCFNLDALGWHSSYDTDDKKKAAFNNAGLPITEILVAKRN